MALGGPQPLDASHRLEAFDCGKATLNDWSQSASSNCCCFSRMHAD